MKLNFIVMDGHAQYTPSRSDDWLVHDGNEVSGAHSIGSGASPTLAYSNGRPARPQGQMQHHEGDVGLVDQVHAYLVQMPRLDRIRELTQTLRVLQHDLAADLGHELRQELGSDGDGSVCDGTMTPPCPDVHTQHRSVRRAHPSVAFTSVAVGVSNLPVTASTTSVVTTMASHTGVTFSSTRPIASSTEYSLDDRSHVPMDMDVEPRGRVWLPLSSSTPQVAHSMSYDVQQPKHSHRLPKEVTWSEPDRWVLVDSPSLHAANFIGDDNGIDDDPCQPLQPVSLTSRPNATRLVNVPGAPIQHPSHFGAHSVSRSERPPSSYQVSGNCSLDRQSSSNGVHGTPWHRGPSFRSQTQMPDSGCRGQTHAQYVPPGAMPLAGATAGAAQMSTNGWSGHTGAHMVPPGNVPLASATAGAGPRKPKKITSYDGKTSWSDYLVQFEIAADLNKWSKEEKAMELATSLTGSARAVLSDLKAADRLDYDALVKKLTLRFDPKDLEGIYQTQLKGRRRRRNESIPELVQEISRLTRKAFPKADEDTRDYMAVSSFITALSDEAQELFVYQKDPKKIEEAGRAAMAYETFQASHRNQEGPPALRGMQGTSPSTIPPLDQILPQTIDFLLSQLMNLKTGTQDDGTQDTAPQYSGNYGQQRGDYGQQTGGPRWQGRPPRGPCFNCGETGHWRRDCSKPRRRRTSGDLPPAVPPAPGPPVSAGQTLNC